MELYYATGPEIVSYLKGLGHSVFLDLKLHDIPNTVQVRHNPQAPLRNKAPSLPLDKGFLLLGKELKIP